MKILIANQFVLQNPVLDQSNEDLRYQLYGAVELVKAIGASLVKAKILDADEAKRPVEIEFAVRFVLQQLAKINQTN